MVGDMVVQCSVSVVGVILILHPKIKESFVEKECRCTKLIHTTRNDWIDMRIECLIFMILL